MPEAADVQSTAVVLGPITVGLDGSGESAVAARWALAEGARWRCPVVAIVAWNFLEQAHPGQKGPYASEWGERSRIRGE